MKTKAGDINDDAVYGSLNAVLDVLAVVDEFTITREMADWLFHAGDEITSLAERVIARHDATEVSKNDSVQ